MPVLRICTNQSVPDAAESLLSGASALVAQQLSKPEAYVMVILEPPMPMMFAGSTEPACYMELKSIGLHENHTQALSQALCQWASEVLGVEPVRTYIEFADPPRQMFGWNSGTF